jgi:hypothetical protein
MLTTDNKNITIADCNIFYNVADADAPVSRYHASGNELHPDAVADASLALSADDVARLYCFDADDADARLQALHDDDDAVADDALVEYKTVYDVAVDIAIHHAPAMQAVSGLIHDALDYLQERKYLIPN